MAYKLKQSGDYRKRRNFSMIKNSLELDNLLGIQKESYQWFTTDGIKEVFETFSPIESFSGNLSLEFNNKIKSLNFIQDRNSMLERENSHLRNQLDKCINPFEQ